MTEDELQRALRFFVAGKMAGAGFPKEVEPATMKEWVREFIDMNGDEPHIRTLRDAKTGELWVEIGFS